MQRTLVLITEAVEKRGDAEKLVGTFAIAYPQSSSLARLLRLSPEGVSRIGRSCAYFRRASVKVKEIGPTEFDNFSAGDFDV